VTAQQETLFVCDRCREKITVPLQNGPVTSRSLPPDGWVTIWQDDVTKAPVHFCPACRAAFRQLLHQR
jgi:hypothetical protein